MSIRCHTPATREEVEVSLRGEYCDPPSGVLSRAAFLVAAGAAAARSPEEAVAGAGCRRARTCPGASDPNSDAPPGAAQKRPLSPAAILSWAASRVPAGAAVTARTTG